MQSGAKALGAERSAPLQKGAQRAYALGYGSQLLVTRLSLYRSRSLRFTRWHFHALATWPIGGGAHSECVSGVFEQTFAEANVLTSIVLHLNRLQRRWLREQASESPAVTRLEISGGECRMSGSRLFSRILWSALLATQIGSLLDECTNRAAYCDRCYKARSRRWHTRAISSRR